MNGKSPAEDPTSIGSILIAMAAINSEDLAVAVDRQKKSTIDELLGKMLVADGYCTSEQIDVALAAQEAMRSRDKKQRALAVAEIARRRKQGTNGARERMLAQSARIVKKITATDHHAVCTETVAPAEMLAKSAER